jgi:hypothetical protein
MDILAFAAQSPLTTGFEVRLDNVVRNVVEGGDGYICHMLTWSPHYLQHVGDDDFAIIDKDSITGDPDAGRLVALRYIEATDKGKSRESKGPVMVNEQGGRTSSATATD